MSMSKRTLRIVSETENSCWDGPDSLVNRPGCYTWHSIWVQQIKYKLIQTAIVQLCCVRFVEHTDSSMCRDKQWLQLPQSATLNGFLAGSFAWHHTIISTEY